MANPLEQARDALYDASPKQFTGRRAQLAKEGTAVDADWGVVGCMYTAEPVETPMAPITMLRNALGVEEGGSGVLLDRAAYARSVAFWKAHANWR